MIRTRTITVVCKGCQTHLLEYIKGGTGGLVKCFIHKIVRDSCSNRGICNNCGSVFGRMKIIKNMPALWIVRSKVFVKG